MAIAKVEKIFIFTHKLEKEELLKTLQNLSLVHVSDIWQSPHFSDYTKELERPAAPIGEDILQRVKKVIKGLKNYGPSQNGGLFGTPKEKISSKEFHEIAQSFDPKPIISEFEKIQARKNSLKLEKKSIEEQLKAIEPWVETDIEPESLGKSEYSTVLTGSVSLRKLELLEEIPAEYQVLNHDNKRAYIAIAFLNEDEETVRRALANADFEIFEIRENLKELKKKLESELEALEREGEELENRLRKMASEYLKPLKVFHDFYADIMARKEVESLSLHTEEAFVIEGWVKQEDKEALNQVLSRFRSVSYTYAEPLKDEKPPVVLQNAKWAEPYELITEMYGLPDPREVDPTPLLAPFFALFFGVCLTDAAYGLILMLLSIWAIKKFRGDNKLLKIMAWGGAFTIVAGMLTGGWFGDLFVRLKIPALIAVRNKFMWFDPMEKPMQFFYVSLALGYIQILWGLLIGFYNKWKWGERLNGVANELAWVIFLLGLVLTFVFHQNFGKWMIYGALILILLLSGTSKNPILRVLQGLYNIYGGVGFLGDLLSYVRLMALGMVTAGIAMAVNITAQLVIGIPILGWILAFLIFIGGHIFSIAVNVLGAFVHTMRLQYVEFFTKFYQNGGRPFRPFGPRHEFVEVMEQ